MFCLSLISCGFLFIAGMLGVLYVFGYFWVTVVRINLNISRYLFSECKWHICSCLFPLVLCSILHISADELGWICLLSVSFSLPSNTHTHSCLSFWLCDHSYWHYAFPDPTYHNQNRNHNHNLNPILTSSHTYSCEDQPKCLHFAKRPHFTGKIYILVLAL